MVFPNARGLLLRNALTTRCQRVGVFTDWVSCGMGSASVATTPPSVAIRAVVASRRRLSPWWRGGCRHFVGVFPVGSVAVVGWGWSLVSVCVVCTCVWGGYITCTLLVHRPVSRPYLSNRLLSTCRGLVGGRRRRGSLHGRRRASGAGRRGYLRRGTYKER